MATGIYKRPTIEERFWSKIKKTEAITQAENKRRGIGLKLNMERANEIRKLYNKGIYKQQELADLYKVAQGDISNIINNKRWAIA